MQILCLEPKNNIRILLEPVMCRSNAWNLKITSEFCWNLITADPTPERYFFPITIKNLKLFTYKSLNVSGNDL